MLSGSAWPLDDGSGPTGGVGGGGGRVESSANGVSSRSNSDRAARREVGRSVVAGGVRARVAGRGHGAYFTTTDGESPPPKAAGTVCRRPPSKARGPVPDRPIDLTR